ncbi:MAG TPA: pyridoxamine 5'-phosphate oxidase family protein [Geobacteraceae bacterium]
MKLNELLAQQGVGVMATANRAGVVNTAIYARPHFIDDETLAWGMTDGRTLRNVRENPHASFLFRVGEGFSGVRLGLSLVKIEDEGALLAEIRTNAERVAGPGAGLAVNHAAYFRIEEMRSLV